MNTSDYKPSKPAIVPFSIEFGEYLKQKRLHAGLSQSDISEHLGYTSSQMVSKWERGLCGPKFQDLSKLIKLLHIDKQELMERMMTEQERIFNYHLKLPKND